MPKDLLAANLKTLMREREDLNTLPKITARGGPPNGVLDRIRRADSACRIDTLAQLARVFGLEPWQLLVADLDPKNPPSIEMTSAQASAVRQHLDALARVIPRKAPE
jgi:hypothetical protein